MGFNRAAIECPLAFDHRITERLFLAQLVLVLRTGPLLELMNSECSYVHELSQSLESYDSIAEGNEP